MTCYNHPDVQALGFCRECGRALCGACQRPAEGTIFCQEHSPLQTAPPPPPQADPSNPYLRSSRPAAVQTSPGLAFALGLIPGVGAIYNGQYLKGLVHVFIFGLLVSLAANVGSSGEPMIGLMIMGFYFYMAFEAFHTARKRQAGVVVEEWSSLIASGRYTSAAPVGPIVLIGIGVLFLLDTLGVFEFHDLARFWPVLLIAAGVGMLYNRLSIGRRASALHQSIESPAVESTRE